MSYEVLARRWRPRQFDEVVGQDHVVQTMKNAIAAGRLAHAYLLVGPRGIGKTSVARIFAKALNCVDGPTAAPCDKCDSCRHVAEGTDIDVLEIDGASNTGVDQVRDLRETVKYSPMRSRFKIYIIDEVHMLSVAAFNALLKTLEEPPDHVKFVFATTESQRVLPTIVSRCQRFDLRRIPVPLIVKRLAAIVESEKVKVAPDALLAIARGAEGALRDAESALDQMIAFTAQGGPDSEISESDVLSVFGLVSRTMLEGVADRILSGDMPGLIRMVAEMDSGGKDLQRIIIELLDHFRNLLVYRNVGNADGALDLAEQQVEALKRQSKHADNERLLRVVGILVETGERMRHAMSKRTLLETALIRSARAATVVSIEDILARIASIRDTVPSEAPDTAGDIAPREEPGETTAPPEPVPAPAPAPKPGAQTNALPRSAGPDLAVLRERWSEVCSSVARLAVGTGKALLDAVPAEVSDDKVLVEFDPEFESEVANFRSQRARRALDISIGNALGRKVTVEVRVAAGPLVYPVQDPPDPESAPPEDAGEPEAAQRGPAHPPAAAPGAPARDWANEPAVKKIVETYKGRITDVRA